MVADEPYVYGSDQGNAANLDASGLGSAGGGPNSYSPAGPPSGGGGAAELESAIADAQGPEVLGQITGALRSPGTLPGPLRANKSVTVGRTTYTLTPEEVVILLQMANGATQALTPGESDTETQTAQQQSAVRDLGEQRSVAGFISGAGSVINALVPDEGSSGSLEIAFNIPINGSPVSFGLRFKGTAERADGHVTLGLTVTFAGNLDLSIWWARAWVRAEVGGYLQASGNDGTEAIRLMMYGIERRMAGEPRLASAIFDEGYGASVEREMGEGDYVDSGLVASLSGGFGLGSGEDDNVSASGEYRTGTRISRGEDGAIESHGSRSLTGTFTASIAPFGGNGKVQGTYVDGNCTAISVEVAAETELELDQWEEVVGPEFLGQFIRTIGGLLSGQSGLFSDNGAQKFGSIVSLVTGTSGASFGGAVAAQSAIHEATSELADTDPGARSAAKVSYGIKFKGGVQAGGPSFEVQLERKSTIQLGRDIRSPIFVKLESIQPVLRYSNTGSASRES